MGYQDGIKMSKLLSKRDALGYFLHVHKEKNLTIREALTAVTDKFAKIWDRACIPIDEKKKMRGKFDTFLP